MKLVNTAVLSHPWNWVVIGLIALFWLIFIVALFPQPSGVTQDGSVE